MSSNAYNDGWNAFQRGHSPTSCPYRPGQQEVNDWLDGWFAAKSAARSDDELTLLRGVSL